MTTEYSLLVVPPEQVLDANLIATDVAEDDYDEFDLGDTFNTGDFTMVAAEHAVYQSLTDGNTGNTPATSPLAWRLYRPTNRWRLLDTKNSTKTAKAGGFYYRFAPSVGINCVAAFGMEGHTAARVRQIHPTLGTIYDQTLDFLPLPTGSTWYDWVFSARSQPLSQFTLIDLFPFPDTELRVDFEGGDDLAVGTLMMGFQVPVGMGVKRGAGASLADYSRRVQNFAGDFELTQGNYSRLKRLPVLIALSEVEAAEEFLVSRRSLPTLYIGLRNSTFLTAFGFFETLDTVFTLPLYLDMQLNVQGLT